MKIRLFKKQKKRKKELLKLREYSEVEFDKLITLLASGALAITFGFADNIKMLGSSNLILLRLSWIFFGSTLVAMILSHLSCKFSVDLELTGRIKTSDRFDNITRILNYLAPVLLITGFILLITYLN